MRNVILAKFQPSIIDGPYESVATPRVAKRRDPRRNACVLGQRGATERRAPLYLEARVAAV